ncbi:MAG: MMPL family transporter [Mariprofundaceae bacterium]
MADFINKLDHSKRWVFALLLAVVVFAGWQFPAVQIDTDPEHMLSETEQVLIDHHQVKKDFKLSDLIVVGVVDAASPQGVLRPEVLQRMEALSKAVLRIEGVVKVDVMSLSTSDTIAASGGLLDIHTIMPKAPTTQEGADKLKALVLNDPLLVEKLGSGDGQGLALYVPIKDKMMSFVISQQIEAEIAEITGGDSTEQYHIAGLPVAEDTFGHDMFIQMAISAPLAGLVLMLMLWWFFRHWAFVAGPMMVAMFAVIVTMGSLIGMGFSVHIMSSMIAIFLMPVAVVNSVHILSHFFDHYSPSEDIADTLSVVLQGLFKPMLYTTLTTMVGFGSLAFTPIEPVRIFGAYIAFGVFISWLVTMVLLPAFLLSLGHSRLSKIVKSHKSEEKQAVGSFLPKLGRAALNKAGFVSITFAGLFALAFYGMSLIVVNDNPVNWFKDGEKIRVADKVMNHHFAGTYMSFLRFNGKPEDMKRPEVAKWVEGLQSHMEAQPTVGKATSYVDLIKRVNWAMHDENNIYSVVPDSKEEIGQYLFLFGMSGNPRDLDHFLDYDAKSAGLWMQLSSGDNQSMLKVIEAAQSYMSANPAPESISTNWAGLTYINTVWQDKMVGGMADALLGSFIMVFILMLVLFRSIAWALLAMLPLSFTIAFAYGVIGLIGKSYDMPVAVLSALALGLSVDFAIHFIERYREERAKLGRMDKAMDAIFGETSRAIAKNALIVSIGFTPLLFAPLVPYITVGVLLASIMALSWIATIMLLPALVRQFNIGEKGA